MLLTPIAGEPHTSTATVTVALTTSIVVAAVAAIPLGHWLDRHGGRVLMTAGSLLGVVAVVAWSQVQQVWQLYAVFVLIGLAGATSLYEARSRSSSPPPARNAQRPARGHHRRRFASSIFFPLTGFLWHLGWRNTCSSSPYCWPSAVGVLLITYLHQAGHAATVAATLSGLLGVLSVTGRLITTGAARRIGMTAITALVFAVQAVGVLALPYLSHSVAGAALCVVAFGFGFGVATIAKPAIVADRYGTTRYAIIAASMALPITLARAFAPIGAAAIAPNAFLTAAGIICLASATLLWSTHTRRSPGTR